LFLSPRLLADLRTAEGLRLVGYPDGGGVPTNGYGHTGKDVWVHQVITVEQAEHWLEDDADGAAAYAVHLPEWPALDTEARRNAIIEIVFNMGPHKWTTLFPQTRQSIQTQDWPSAEAHLRASPLWISEVGSARVYRLAAQLGSGLYPTSTTAATG
jgi:GH24 family phage-related lysozyme (muramidase)